MTDEIDIEDVDFERLEEEIGAERVYFALENGSDAVEFRRDGVHFPQLFVNNGEVRHGFSSPDGLFSAGLTMSPEQARAWARAFEVAAQLADKNDDHGTVI